MIKNGKRKGTRNEHKTIRVLEAAGYLCVRAAASLGPFDIVGISPADVVLVQVKTNRWPSEAELESLAVIPTPQGVRKLVHRWDDHRRFPHVKEISS